MRSDKVLLGLLKDFKSPLKGLLQAFSCLYRSFKPLKDLKRILKGLYKAFKGEVRVVRKEWRKPDRTELTRLCTRYTE